MISRPPGNAALYERIESLLRATADMLGAHIEIHTPATPFRVTSRSNPDRTASCQACRRSDPSLHGRCGSQRNEPPWHSFSSGIGPVHWVCPHRCEVTVVPLRIQEITDSFLVAIRPQPALGDPPQPDRPEALRFLTHLSDLLSEHLSMTDELSSISGEFSRRDSELSLLHSISRRLSGQEDMRQAIRMILEQARGAVGARAAFLSIPEKRILDAAVAGGRGEGSLEHAPWERVARLVEGRCRSANLRFFSGTQWDLDPDAPLFTTPAQIVAVTLREDHVVCGTLGLVHFDPVMRERLGDLKLLESISGRVAMAVASSDLYENLKDFLMGTVKSLVSALEAKDTYTCGHSERVNLLSLLIGKTMGLADDDLEVLRWASILHDVGKIGMPESILKKPGRLTAEEFAIMKEHPDRGYRVLAPIRQLASASLAVRFHHEMFNGLGYPLGLRGEEIPILSRVIAVADTYDALTSTRSYRSRRSPDEAFSVIHSVRGTQLDARVVDSLATLMPFIREHEVMLKVGALDSSDDPEEEGDREIRAA